MMRYSQGELPILSAETYDPGHGPIPAGRTGGRKTQQRENQRKRKAHSPEVGSDQLEDEEKKRTRGRPRLDTKDETAAERRRTQIRLAQRAYRNRKENAIQTLERKVQELKGANEEMSNAFMRLHDFAVGHGLLEQAPEFARQLRTTTQKFMSLARKSSEDSGKEDGQTDSNPDVEETTPSQLDKGLSERVVDIRIPKARDSVPNNNLYGGIVVSQEEVPESERTTTDISLNFEAADSNAVLDYEVVTYPTLDNASFPFGTDFGFGSTANTAPNPNFGYLPAPGSYAAAEATFGRRLQRTAVERALTLISMPNPPESRYSRIFGFCLLFESKENIQQRLQAIVTRTRHESLFNWEYPFLNLGGAGTHLDTMEFADQPIGNQGTLEIRKPKSNTGFGTGPYNSKIVEAGNLLDKDYQIGLPGYRTDFYDCDEVEVYLRQRGVTIPSGVDHITAEIDISDFYNAESSGSTSLSSPNDIFGPSALEAEMIGLDGVDRVRDLALAMHTDQSASRSPSASSGDASTAITIPSPGPEPSKSWTATDPLLDGVYSAPSNPFMETSTMAGAFGNTSLIAFSGISGTDQESSPRRKVVAVDVNHLIFELTERATCLGRTPGLTKSDINAAFMAATRSF